MPLVSFSPGQVISSSNVNSNFALCVLTDTSRTITVTHTFSASQTFSAGLTSGAAITLSTAASKVVPGATSLSLRNNADSADNLLVSDAGLVTARIGVVVTSGSSTLNNSDGPLILNNSLAASTYRWLLRGDRAGSTKFYLGLDGSDNFCILDNTNGSANVNVTNAGVVTIRAGLTVTAGALTFGAAAGKLVPGATSFSLRNNADSLDNFIVTDAGGATLRAGLTVGNGLTVSAGSVTSTANSFVSGVNQVVGSRVTGYTAMTNTKNKVTSYDTTTITLAQLAARVGQIQDDLTTHGLIGA